MLISALFVVMGVADCRAQDGGRRSDGSSKRDRQVPVGRFTVSVEDHEGGVVENPRIGEWPTVGA